jgi:hypothetical protein
MKDELQCVANFILLVCDDVFEWWKAPRLAAIVIM